jgi:hypothetical protein
LAALSQEAFLWVWTHPHRYCANKGTVRSWLMAIVHNRAVDGWDLIYQFDYPSTIAEQTTGFVGTWGPIVETFQNPYQNTDFLGFLNALLFSADANGQWDGSVLTSAQSTLRNDGHGFTPLFLDANYSFVVTS